jgi:hypothetical protein
MRMMLVVAVLGTVLGGLVGTGIVRAMAARQQLPHAVMWLMGNHYQHLKTAVQAGACQNVARDWQGLRFLQGDIPQAFAKLHRDSSEFRQRAAALGTALETAPNPPTDCAALDHTVKQVGEACEACHRKFG